MKKFRFPLDRVRQYRQLQLEAEQARMEQLFAKSHALNQLEQNLAGRRVEADEEVRRRVAAGCPVEPAVIASMTGFRAYCRQMGEALARRRAELDGQIAAQRAVLSEARRRYEMLDRLRGRDLAKWNGELGRELDETAEESFLSRWKRA